MERNRAMTIEIPAEVSFGLLKKDDVVIVMRLAGLAVVHVWELTNQYWPENHDYDDVRTPWWLVMTDVGLIQIGRRKRVLSISWKATTVRGVVTDDAVTRGDDHVHAYTLLKAVEYLQRLRVIAKTTTREATAVKKEIDVSEYDFVLDDESVVCRGCGRHDRDRAMVEVVSYGHSIEVGRDQLVLGGGAICFCSACLRALADHADRCVTEVAMASLDQQRPS